MFLGWIPIVGPLLDGLFSFLNKTVDLKAVKYKVDGSVDIEAIKAATQIIDYTKDDIGVRLTRDIVLFPSAVWFSLVIWDTIVALRWPHLMFHVAGFGKTEVPYLPVAILTFLFGNTWLAFWRRR